MINIYLNIIMLLVGFLGIIISFFEMTSRPLNKYQMKRLIGSNYNVIIGLTDGMIFGGFISAVVGIVVKLPGTDGFAVVQVISIVGMTLSVGILLVFYKLNTNPIEMPPRTNSFLD